MGLHRRAPLTSCRGAVVRPLTQKQLFRSVIIQSAAVLEAVKARPGNVGVLFDGKATADLDSLCARRPKEICGRDGRKPCGAVEQKKAPKQRKALTRSHSYKSRCGAVSLGRTYPFSAPFVWRCLSSPTVAPFPHPAHRTGQAVFPHPALGQDLTPSPTARRARARSSVRAHSARKGARVDRSRPCIA
jgi:hypothetical protein